MKIGFVKRIGHRKQLAMAIGALFVTAGAMAADGVAVRSLDFDGVVPVPAKVALETQLQQALGHTLDREGADGLAQALTQTLRKSGYPVGMVVLTDEEWAKFAATGDLRVHVLEGDVGRVVVNRNGSAVSNTRLERTALQALCGRKGTPCTLTSEGVQRAELLLQDLPGVKLFPLTLSPEGVGVGETSVGLDVEESARRFTGAVSVDDYGVAASGLMRFGASARMANLFHQGDVLELGGQVSNRGEYTGQLGFSMPLGYSGWRGSANVARTAFNLTQVDSTGTAVTGEVGVSYPIARALDGNWVVGVDGYDTVTEQTVAGESAFAPQHLEGVRVSLLANAGDRPLALAQSYWSASAVASFGRVAQTLPFTDVTGTLGRYDKLALSYLGKKVLGGGWYTLVNVRGQLASRNLAGYEAMSVGGVTGVRAYSSSEGTVNQGVLLSGEVRKLVTLRDGSQLAPGVWLDYLNGSVLHSPYTGWQTSLGYPDANMSNHRSLGGWGVGVDYASPKGLNASLTVGWKLPGSASSAVGAGGGPEALFSLGARF